MARDPELALRLKQAPNARERGRLLGVDYDAVSATGWRLRAGVVAISVIYIVIFAVVAWVLLSWQTAAPGPLSIDPRPLGDGLTAALVVVVARMVVTGVVMQILSSSRMAPMRQQMIALPLNSVIGTVGLLIALAVLPAGSVGTLILGFAVLGGLFGIAGIESLPLALIINDPNLPKAVALMRQVPADMTLFGGQARWLLVCFALGLLDATGLGLLFSAAPIAAVLVVPAHAALAVLTFRRSWQLGLKAGMPIAAASAAAIFIAGVVVN